MTKTCTKCGVEKDIEEFHRRHRSKDGHRTSCKACDAALEKARKASPAPAPNPVPVPDKVIGRIEPTKTVIKEVAVTDNEEIEKQMAAEYAALLNQKLPVRKRAALMVKIAKNIQGFQAGLAMKAIQDINMATGVTSKTGARVELGPLFVMPDNTDVKITG